MSVLRIDNPEACGLGEGERCCAFLASQAVMVCGRTIPGVAAVIRERLRAGTMGAKGDPGDTPYPECQRARRGLEPA